MSTDVKESWISRRLPVAEWCARFCAPDRARAAPYFGALPALIFGALIFMAASGLVLSVHYDPAQAFGSLQFIDRDVADGWLIHGFHETGATVIFGAVFLQLFRGIYSRAYRAPGELVWLLTVKLFALLLLVGWLGYVLSDGAVSYWSLTGSANAAMLMGGLPGAVGSWFFGGPNQTGTLARMEVFHSVLALAIFAIVALHHIGAKRLRPQVSGRAGVRFHPYYTAQVFVAFVGAALVFSVLVFFAPHLGENKLNAAMANPLVLPATLGPPWYLAPVRALGTVFPGVYGGVFGGLAGIAVLAALPWLDRSNPAARTGFGHRFLVVVLALDVIGLGLCSAAAPSALASVLTVVFTVWYFLHFLVLTPVVSAWEAK